MSVFLSLAKEHVLLLNLVGRLERAAADPDSRCAERDTRNFLLILLKALEAHEQLEHLVFDQGPQAPSAALALVERQHLALAALHSEAHELLQGVSGEDGVAVRRLAVRLAHLLRRHFTDEERTLWPSFNASVGRSRLQRLDRLARAQVRAMHKELDSYLIAVEEYLA